ncbi:MAG: tripartite tricarboxylate transporter substrate binding protein, partial [Youngiibacter sp.]|nr:tripartite tricarboxylate transporter substrate binding protein [Youngiibacter sp.]
EKRYEGNLKDAPTLSEVGSYKNVEVPVWRGVAAPKGMSAEAVKYYTEALKKVSDSAAWKTEYIEIYKLISDYKNSTDASTFVKQYESEFMASKGIK